VAHRNTSRYEHEEDQERVGGDQADLPELPDLRIARELRGREHGLSDQVEHRRQRVDDEPFEPVVDRLLDPAGQIPESRVRCLVAADGRVAARAARRVG